MKPFYLLGCPMHSLTMNETIALIKQKIHAKHFTKHSVVNVAKLVNMQNDAELKASVASCDIINIDGMGVLWGARLAGYDVKERVTGIDLFHRLIAMSAKEGISVFFLGAELDIVKTVVSRIQKKHANLKIAGFHHGFFDDDKAVMNIIKQSKAEILFVAMSSPKKENFIHCWEGQSMLSFVMGVGGTFDVVAGKVKRAPILMQKMGLEWCYRIIQEPKRMWRRYLITNTKYAWLLCKVLYKKIISSR